MMPAKLTTEGRVILTLEHGCHLYSQLQRETKLSDRWLMKKLDELKRTGVIKREAKWYKLAKTPAIHPYERSLYRRTLQLPQAVAHLLERCPYIQAIVLYGSTANYACLPRSDADLIVVVRGKPLADAKREIVECANELELTIHLSIEPLVLSVDDYLSDVSSVEGGVIYGITSAYEVLYDRTRGRLTRALHDRVEEIRRTHIYLEDVRQWVRAR
jgi:predicted nucleotidyltransferase